MIEGLSNPFEEDSMDLVVLDTKEIAGPASVASVRNVKIGQEQFQAFHQRKPGGKNQADV